MQYSSPTALEQDCESSDEGDDTVIMSDPVQATAPVRELVPRKLRAKRADKNVKKLEIGGFESFHFDTNINQYSNSQ